MTDLKMEMAGVLTVWNRFYDIVIIIKEFRFKIKAYSLIKYI